MIVKPNVEQVKAIIRWVVSVFGGVIAGYFAGKGVANSSEILEVLSNPANISLLASIIVAIWGMFVHTEGNAVAVVDAIAKRPDSAVKGVVTENTESGRALAASLPGITTVVAGSVDAASISRANIGGK